MKELGDLAKGCSFLLITAVAGLTLLACIVKVGFMLLRWAIN